MIKARIWSPIKTECDVIRNVTLLNYNLYSCSSQMIIKFCLYFIPRPGKNIRFKTWFSVLGVWSFYGSSMVERDVWYIGVAYIEYVYLYLPLSSSNFASIEFSTRVQHVHMSNTMGVNNGAGTAYPSHSYELTQSLFCAPLFAFSFSLIKTMLSSHVSRWFVV